MSTPSRVELTEMGAAHIAASAARQATWRRLLRLRWGVGAAGVLLLIIASAAVAPLIAPYDPLAVDIRHRLSPPAWMDHGTAEHLLGTDQVGRDLLARMIYGGGVSLAGRALGMGHVRLVFRQIVPNLVSTIVVIATLQVAQVIILESFLSFLGLGVQPPTPAWGNMLGEGRVYMLNSWWIATFPGLAIFVTTLVINLMGNALRDWLDPHQVDHERGDE